MGDYTAIFLAADMKGSCPDSVKDVLRFMIGVCEKPEKLPEHEFFKSHSWQYLFRCDAAYLPGIPVWSFDGFHITVFSKIKNYDEEIEKFFSWIEPYIKEDAIAFSQFEYADKQTIVSFRKDVGAP